MHFAKTTPLHSEEIDSQARFAFADTEARHALATTHRWQEADFERGQRIMRIGPNIRWQCHSHIAAGSGMGEIEIQRTGTVAPGHAQLISQCQERVRADQQPARTKELILRQSFDNAKVTRRCRRATLRQCRRSLARHGFERRRSAFARRLDRRNRRTFWPQIVFAFTAIQFLERPISKLATALQPCFLYLHCGSMYNSIMHRSESQ